MQKLSKELHCSTVLSLVQVAYPVVDTDDVWLANFLKTLIIFLLLHPLELIDKVSYRENNKFLLSNLVLKCFIELA